MANDAKPISQLPPANPLTGAELFACVQSGATRRTQLPIANPLLFSAVQLVANAQLVPSGVLFTAVPDVSSFDTDAYWPDDGTGAVLAPFNGYYEFNAIITPIMDSAGFFSAFVRNDTQALVSPTLAIATDSDNAVLSTLTVPWLSSRALAGDTFTLRLEQNTGSDVDTTWTWWMRWVGDRPVSPIVTGFHDLFVDVDGTLLVDHTMTQGLGWQLFGGTSWDIQSDKAAPANTTAGFVLSDALISDCTQTLRTNFGTSRFSSLAGRCSNGDNGWWIQYRRNDGGLLVIERVAGVDTTRADLGPIAIVTNTDYTLSAVWTGNSVEVFLDGVSKGSYGPMTTNLTATLFGWQFTFFDVNESSLRNLEITVTA